MSYGTNNIIQYTSGDGNDVITGYDSSNKIQISGSSYSTQASGSDMIIKVGSGKMTLKNARYSSVNITTTSKNFIEEHWFTEDNNFNTDDIMSILSTTSDYASNSFEQIDINYDLISLKANKQSQLLTCFQNKK